MRTQEEYDAIFELHDKGLNKCQISRELNIPRSTIKTIIQNRGVEKVAKLPILKISDPSGKHYGFESRRPYQVVDPKAYSYILGQYLGDGYINKTNHNNCYKLRIFTNSRDTELIQTIVQNLQAVFSKNKIGIYKQKHANCVEVYMYSNQLPDLFPQHGPDRKHTRPIILSEEQRIVLDTYPWEFLKGLIHSDGCRYKGMGLIQYNFCNKSKDIINLFCEYLEKCGVQYTQHYKSKTDSHIVSIYKRTEVAKLEEHIGKRNPNSP